MPLGHDAGDVFEMYLHLKVIYRCLALALGIASLIAFACGTAQARPVHASSARQAVRIILRPYVTPGYNFSNCTRQSPRRTPSLTCPETARLRRWLRVRRLPPDDSGLPFCRCQSSPRTARIVDVHRLNRTLTRVDVRWDFGANRSSHLYATDTFVVVHRPDGWLIDDEYCSGRPRTSVYEGVAGETPCYRH